MPPTSNRAEVSASLYFNVLQLRLSLITRISFIALSLEKGLEAFNLSMPFNQAVILEENKEYISKMIVHILGLKDVVLNIIPFNAEDPEDPSNKQKGFENAEPGKPGVEVSIM